MIDFSGRRWSIMPIVGSRPKKGIYKCIVCDQKVTVDYFRPTLSFCPNCDGVSFISVASNNDL
jgi:Zn finger protein HypA/HybF involved in hydrogenase expression